MLIITQSLFAASRRPAYLPRDRWAQTCVRDTELGKVVFGPATRRACQGYMNNHKEG